MIFCFRVSWSNFVILVTLETEINTSQSRYKLYHFTLTLSPHYSVKLTAENSRPLHAVCYVKPVVPNFLLKVIQCSFSCFSRILENSFSNLLMENVLNSYRFLIKMLSSELTSVILTCNSKRQTFVTCDVPQLWRRWTIKKINYK